MTENSNLPLIAGRTSKSIKIFSGPSQFKELHVFSREQAKNYRVLKYSNNGELLAFCDAVSVLVVQLPSYKVLFEIEKPKTAALQFSPKDNYLVTWEPYAVQNNVQDNSNLHVWNSTSGMCIKSFIQKKYAFPLLEWTDDESVVARKVNNEIHFHENNDFDNTSAKLHMQKISDFSLSSGCSPYHVSCYVPGTKGQPSFVRLFKYPHFDGPGAAVANKSFFKADTVNFYWNSTGKGLLVLTSTDVDKSGASYYGEQTLHYLGTNGESCMVQLAKNGPIYSLQWSPSADQFAVCYGFMPAKATVYNLKSTPVFDFGTGPRNALAYNVHGNLLLIYGFGNLRGNVEIWDMQKHKLIQQITASDSTYLEWSPDGIHFCTATTAPRLQVGNGYKIWHYSGSLLHEHKCSQDEKLYELKWQDKSRGSFKIQDISYKQVSGVAPTQPEASKQAYVPPSARGNPHMIPKIREQYEPPSNAKPNSENLSKNAAKNKKKKEAKKLRKGLETNDNVTAQSEPKSSTNSSISIPTVGDPEKDKKIRNLKKKIDAIEKLKEQQKAGKTLEINQLEKIKKEQELQAELEELTI